VKVITTILLENLLNGRPDAAEAFKTLINLTPGAVLNPATGTDPPSSASNGQRTSTNYSRLTAGQRQNLALLRRLADPARRLRHFRGIRP